MLVYGWDFPYKFAQISDSEENFNGFVDPRNAQIMGSSLFGPSYSICLHPQCVRKLRKTFAKKEKMLYTAIEGLRA